MVKLPKNDLTHLAQVECFPVPHETLIFHRYLELYSFLIIKNRKNSQKIGLVIIGQCCCTCIHSAQTNSNFQFLCAHFPESQAGNPTDPYECTERVL